MTPPHVDLSFALTRKTHSLSLSLVLKWMEKIKSRKKYELEIELEINYSCCYCNAEVLSTMFLLSHSSAPLLYYLNFHFNNTEKFNLFNCQNWHWQALWIKCSVLKNRFYIFPLNDYLLILMSIWWLRLRFCFLAEFNLTRGSLLFPLKRFKSLSLILSPNASSFISLWCTLVKFETFECDERTRNCSTTLHYRKCEQHTYDEIRV